MSAVLLKLDIFYDSWIPKIFHKVQPLSLDFVWLTLFFSPSKIPFAAEIAMNHSRKTMALKRFRFCCVLEGKKEIFFPMNKRWWAFVRWFFEFDRCLREISQNGGWRRWHVKEQSYSDSILIEIFGFAGNNGNIKDRELPLEKKGKKEFLRFLRNLEKSDKVRFRFYDWLIWIDFNVRRSA